MPTHRRDDDQFRINTDAVIAFYREHGRTPSQTAKDAEEKRLGIWIRDVRVAARGKGGYTVDDSRLAPLDEHIPGWRGKTVDAAWQEAFDAAVAEWARTRTVPAHDTPVGSFLRRVHRGDAYADRARQLDRAMPGWRKPLDADAAFLSRFEDLVTFVRHNGRYPKQSHRVSADERKLGEFLHRVRWENRTDSLATHRRNMLDDALPGWETTPDPKYTKWLEGVDALAAFRESTGTWPSTSRNVSVEERRAWQVLRRCRTLAAGKGDGSGLWSEEREQILDARVPGWNAPVLIRSKRPASTAAVTPQTESPSGCRSRRGSFARFEESVDALARYREATGMWPRLKAENRSKAERNAAPALTLARRMCREAERTPDVLARIALLDERVPGWRDGMKPQLLTTLVFDRAAAEAAAGLRDTPEPVVSPFRAQANARHRLRAIQVIEFYATHGRLPFQTATDPAERQLGLWVRDARASRHGRRYRFYPSDCLAQLDDFLPGWSANQNHTGGRLARVRLEQLAKAVAA